VSVAAVSDPVLCLLRGQPVPLQAGDPRWDVTADRLAGEGLSGVALGLLNRAGRLGDLTPTARRRLEADLGAVRAEQVVLFDRFEKIAGLLQGAGVPFLIHKGGALAPLVYDRLEDRPMVDIDIVFPPAEWRKVRDALVGAGYRLPAGSHEAFWLENYFNLSVMSPDNPPSHFDLHWGLTQEGRYDIEPEDLFARAVPYDFGPLRLLRLSNEDLLLSLFLHLAYHYFMARLLWLYDMKRVVERWEIDWDRLLARASSWGLITVVAFNAAFLGKVFPGLVPDEVVARVRPGLVRRALTRPFLSSDPCHLFHHEERRLNHFVLGLVAIDRPADAARFAADKLSRSVRWLGRRPKRR